MGQKVIPIGFRLVRNKKWRSTWFANKKDFGNLLIEDFRIREFLKGKKFPGVARFTIKRMGEKVETTIHTARPGLVIGRKGADIETLKADLNAFTGRDCYIEVAEIKRPDLDAQLVADNIGKQLENRVAFRRAMKRALQTTMAAGALGIKVQVGGRLGGAEIARTEQYKEGSVPLHTLRADIDYARARAQTTYGVIGVKVWIYRGEDVIAKSPAAKVAAGG